MIVSLHPYVSTTVFVACIAIMIVMPMIFLGTIVGQHRYAKRYAVAALACTCGALFGLFHGEPDASPYVIRGVIVNHAVSPDDAHRVVQQEKHWTYVGTDDDMSTSYRDAVGTVYHGCRAHFVSAGSHHARFVNVTCDEAPSH